MPFALFGTAGAEDFNYLEMRMLDRRLTSPHRLAIFNGGHTLPPDDLALEAIEWLELQAMISGTRTRDDGVIDGLLDKRRRGIDSAESVAAIHQIEALIADFKGLRDVSPEQARVAALSRIGELRKAIAREPRDDAAERGMLDEVFEWEQGLRNPDLRMESFSRLRRRLEQWGRAAAQPTPSLERDQARRLLSAVSAGVTTRANDSEYLMLIERHWRGNRPRPGG